MIDHQSKFYFEKILWRREMAVVISVDDLFLSADFAAKIEISVPSEETSEKTECFNCIERIDCQHNDATLPSLEGSSLNCLSVEQKSPELIIYDQGKSFMELQVNYSKIVFPVVTSIFRSLVIFYFALKVLYKISTWRFLHSFRVTFLFLLNLSCSVLQLFVVQKSQRKVMLSTVRISSGEKFQKLCFGADLAWERYRDVI